VVQKPVTHFWPVAVIGYVADQFTALLEQLLFIFLPVFDCRNAA